MAEPIPFELKRAIDEGAPQFRDLDWRDAGGLIAGAVGGLCCASLIGHGKSRNSLGDHMRGVTKDALAASAGAAVGWATSWGIRYLAYNKVYEEYITVQQDMAIQVKASCLDSIETQEPDRQLHWD